MLHWDSWGLNGGEILRGEDGVVYGFVHHCTTSVKADIDFCILRAIY